MGEAEFFANSFLVVMIVIAVVILALYLLAWIFAKKPRVGWMIFALVFFVLDTLFMLLIMGITADMIVDIVFHAWVVISLTNGIVSYFKLKKLPVEEPEEQLPEAEFLEIVYRYGGTTKEVLKNDALRSIFLPILRADFKLSELYTWSPKEEKIACPFTVVNGRQDYSAMSSDMTRWLDHGQGHILTVEGSHFFLFEQPEALLHIIKTTLL
jgi:pimeloyl-ACP methyl ester carboxylesterase